MSWQKITLPLTMEIDPKVVEIGKIVWDRYVAENKPAGFAMYHATRGSEGGLNDTRLVYLTPVAAEMCTELTEKYPLEACGIPARDEPDIAFVFGDPLTMSDLLEKYDPSREAAEKAQAATEG